MKMTVSTGEINCLVRKTREGAIMMHCDTCLPCNPKGHLSGLAGWGFMGEGQWEESDKTLGEASRMCQASEQQRQRLTNKGIQCI